MTISKKTLLRAAFWESDYICLDCGEAFNDPVKDEFQACGACGSLDLVNPHTAIQVLEKVEVDEE